MKILYLSEEDWFFWSRRARLAFAAQSAGAEVFVMTRVGGLGEAMQKAGFRVIPWTIARGSINPFRDLRSFYQVMGAYRRLRPDLVHHVSLKPIIYGGIAGRLLGIASVNAITGLGHLFTSPSAKMRALRRMVLLSLRVDLGAKNSRTVLMNPEDCEFLVEQGSVRREQTAVIRGVGVDLNKFSPQAEPNGTPMVLLPARMLWDKGIEEFIQAASLLQARGISARFVLAGVPDKANPSSIPEEQLCAWAASGRVEWWRHRSDMPEVFAQSAMVCLPTYYGEGLPTTLIEAAACGRALVATDIRGCREVVRPGQNGLLVPPRDVPALAEALEALLKDPQLRARMGAAGREIVVREFSAQEVVGKSMAIYRELLGPRWPEAGVETSRPGLESQSAT